jgi:hypothetical protein
VAGHHRLGPKADRRSSRHEGRIYLLGERATVNSTSVVECDSRGTPEFILEYAIAAGFNPRLIGITGEHVYLVDPSGKVTFYPLTRETTSAEVLDASPELLTDVEPVRAAVRKTGYAGRVVIHVDISAEGVAGHAGVQSPAFLTNVPDVMAAISTLRFRPASRAGKQTAMLMTLTIDVF